MWIILEIVVCVLITCICAYLFHNSETRLGEPCTLPLALWLIYGIAALIPIVNALEVAIWIIYLAEGFSDRDIRFKSDSWLGKRY